MRYRIYNQINFEVKKIKGDSTMKRLLNCSASDFRRMKGSELKQAILASEGRTVLGECIVTAEPLVEELTNAEVLAAFGADLILLNKMDVLNPEIKGLPEGKEPVSQVKKMVGRPVGVSLEAVDADARMLEDALQICEGRRVSEKTIAAAASMGIDFLCLSGNPSTGVSSPAIEGAIRMARGCYDGLIFAGKMHRSGVDEEILDETYLMSFVEAGADGILLPAPGTVPGVREEDLHRIIKRIKAAGAICISTIGTSQESGDLDTVRQIALSAKRAGADVQHIGDGSFSSVAVPENVMGLSIAIRGKRHTYFRMAQSLYR